jgi:hypothetical protein
LRARHRTFIGGGDNRPLEDRSMSTNRRAAISEIALTLLSIALIALSVWLSTR